ncbi:endonuclease I family protein [Oceanobacillus zhaokaii]|uniref:endonuclease I family protein n=1 Tax=Oceanobacillus zhaokaii TaxID=2052660 RepID=UPI001FA8A085|nr:endonuclease [Oceanobacillus zhaokaii]
MGGFVPDGNLKSVYSGEERNPEDVIKKDFQAVLKRMDRLSKLTSAQTAGEDQLRKVAIAFPFNCEHVVPQSWFNEQEPMRGDIHHLFTCDPGCNSIRSNYPYHDFSDYAPENAGIKRVEDECGKAEEGLFEPEYGKGTVARAMLYFMIRYQDEIENVHKETIDTKLLLEWHQQFPPKLYEKHRNQSIHDIQGNRNPFIDFPDKMYQVFD